MKRILALIALASLVILSAGCKKEIDPTSVRLDQHELTLHVGENATLTATVASVSSRAGATSAGA